MIKTNYCKKIRGVGRVAEMRGQLGQENWVPCFHPEPCGSEKINMNFSAESQIKNCPNSTGNKNGFRADYHSAELCNNHICL